MNDLRAILDGEDPDIPLNTINGATYESPANERRRRQAALPYSKLFSKYVMSSFVSGGN